MRLLLMLGTLSVIIAVHEFGHAVAMRAYDVPVKEFAVGIGPAVWQTSIDGGTVVSIRALPLGGYTEPDEDAMNALGALPLVVIMVNGMFLSVLVAFKLLLIVRHIKDQDPFVGKSLVSRLHVRLRPLASACIDTLVAWPVMAVYILVMLFVRPRKFFASVMTPIAMLAGVGMRGKKEDQPEGASTQEVRRNRFVLGYVEFLCALCVGFAACNFLPFSPLDGAKIVAVGIAVTFGTSAANAFLNVSSVLFLVLVLLLLLSDLRKIVRKD